VIFVARASHCGDALKMFPPHSIKQPAGSLRVSHETRSKALKKTA
jgi:hypothetical protein